jgi:hypothetical protein
MCLVNRLSLAAVFALFILVHPKADAGTFAPPAGQPDSTAMDRNDPRFIEWAVGITVVRGPMEIDKPELGPASYGAPENVLGKAAGTTSNVVSLGDGGSATLTFAHPIANGPSFDFAVFENGLDDQFLELAFVEVSSNGIDFFRFPSISLTQSDTQVEGFGLLDATNLQNLAGKYRVGQGTPFDLAELAGASPLLDVDAVTHVRFVDVAGCIQDSYASLDSQGHKVNDPWPTPFPSGGFDLGGVGVINAVPEPGACELLFAAALAGFFSAIRRRVQSA